MKWGFKMFSYSEFIHNYDLSVYNYEEPKSNDYQVFVNGKEIPVYTCRISKYPLNTVWPGHQRYFDQSESASFVNIVSDEEINVEVKVNYDYEKVMIKPYSKAVATVNEDEKIKFTLKENGQFVLECDSYHRCLYIFNSKPILCENPEEVTHYFGAGIHFAGKITLKDNESIYVDKDALVYGCVYAENAQNIKVFGNGVFDDTMEERICIKCYENFTNGNIKFYDCRDVKIEGVLFKNSAIWCVNLFGCYDVDINDIKVFGQWRYNTDGIDVVNCQNVFIENSFIHSFDDTITIKGIDRYINIDNKNIHINNCILWCDWGKTCEIGIETACREYENISFTNCDILRGGKTACDIQNGDCAQVHNIRFENINVEIESFYTLAVYQVSDSQIYDKENEIEIPSIISVRNYPFRSPECVELWGIKPMAEIDLTGIKVGAVYDVTFKNINVYYDKAIPLLNDKEEIRVEIIKDREETEYSNISVENITVNGKAFEFEVKND